MPSFIKGPDVYINLDNVTHIAPLMHDGKQEGFVIHFVGQGGTIKTGMAYEEDFDRLLILSPEDRFDRRTDKPDAEPQ